MMRATLTPKLHLQRRKEQNRIAQRQLRERRQQLEAAQALKLQQQQNEIRRLHRLITELRNENFALRSQSHTRRRQSVIPISSLSRGLAISHLPTTTTGPVPTPEPNCKPFLARHSFDYSSLHGAGIHAGASAHRLYEHRHFKSWSSEDQRAPSFVPHVRQPAARGAAQHPGQSTPCAPSRLQTCASQDINKQADVNAGNLSSASGISAVPVTSKPPVSNWLPRNSTPPIGGAAGHFPANAWLTSPQRHQRSPRLDSASATENDRFAPSSVNLAAFWPAHPPSSPNKHPIREDIDHFSAPALSVTPPEFIPTSTPMMSGERFQLRKTSESASSDTNSLTLDSDNHSSFSAMSFNSVHFPFVSPEPLSHHVARRLSPTAIGSCPEAQIEERNPSEANTTICFRSPFAQSNRPEIKEQPSFGLPLSWIETKKFNVEALSPLPTHAKSVFLEVNEMWGSDL